MIKFVKLSETTLLASYEFHSSLGEYGAFDIDKNTHKVSFKGAFDFDGKAINANDIDMLNVATRHIIDDKFPDKYTCAWC